MSTISPIIIQTAKSRDLSPMAKASATNLRLLHPDWEYRFFDDNDVKKFVANEFPRFISIFEGFPRAIQRIDFFRYLAVFRLGGFYFDLDVFLSEKLTPLLCSGCVFPFEELTLNRFLRHRYSMDWEIGNYAFGAAPNDPFLKLIIENCVRAQNDPEWVRPMMVDVPKYFSHEFNVLNTTGPGLISRTLAENPPQARNVQVLFPSDVRDRKSWHMFGKFGVHAMEGSWRTKGSFLRRRLALYWETRLMKRLMPESDKLGPTRDHPPQNRKSQ